MTAEFWEYDPRVGRRWNVDRVHKNSPYEAFGGNPISLADPTGADTISITRTKIIDRMQGQNSGGHSDALTIPERTETTTTVDFNIKRSEGKDVFIFQENIFSTDVNGNQTATMGQPMTLDIDDLASTHPGIAQGQFPIMDGLLGLGTDDMNDRQAVGHFMDMDANFRSYMLGHNPEAQQLQNEDGSFTVMNGLMPAAVNAGMASYVSWRLTPLPPSRFYSVAYKTELPSTLYPGGTYYGHFKAANTALDAAMTADKTFAAQMESLGVEIPRRPSGAIDGVSPQGWVWHHATEPGAMELVPKYQHPSDFSGSFWDVLHPLGAGGMSLWNK